MSRPMRVFKPLNVVGLCHNQGNVMISPHSQTLYFN